MAIADFCTTAQLLTYMRTDATGVDAVTSADAVTAASDAIRQFCNRSFELRSGATTRYFSHPYVYGDYAGDLAFYLGLPGVFPFTAFTSQLPAPLLEVDDFFLDGAQLLSAITVTDFVTSQTYTPQRAYPFNAAANGEPYTHLAFAPGTMLPTQLGQLGVLCNWGFVTAVPTTIQNACLLQASRYVKRRDSVLGVAGIQEMSGTVLRVKAGLDTDVAQMLQSWQRWWI